MTNPAIYDLVVRTDGVALTTVLAAEYSLSLLGPPGPPGPVVEPIEYDLINTSNWTQAHTLPYLPEVRLIDTAGRSVLVQVNYPDATHINIVFPQPFTGKVLLS